MGQLTDNIMFEPLAIEAKRDRLIIFPNSEPTNGIMVRIITYFAFDGLKKYNRPPEAQLEREHKNDADVYNIDPYAYERGKVDSGVAVIENGQNVFVRQLLRQLWSNGLTVQEAHWHYQYNANGRIRIDSQKRKKIVNVFSFRPKSKRSVSIPCEAYNILMNKCFRYCYAWINPNGYHTVNLIGWNDVSEDPEKLAEIEYPPKDIIIPRRPDGSLQKTFHLVPHR